MPKRDWFYLQWIAGILFIALAASFFLCIASDLRFNALLNDTGRQLTASAGTLGLGVSWIVGHGLHGAAMVSVPAMFLLWNRAVSGDESNKVS